MSAASADLVAIIIKESGGGGGIRTHGTLARSTVFKTVAIDHSATPPAQSKSLKGSCESTRFSGLAFKVKQGNQNSG